MLSQITGGRLNVAEICTKCCTVILFVITLDPVQRISTVGNNLDPIVFRYSDDPISGTALDEQYSTNTKQLSYQNEIEVAPL